MAYTSEPEEEPIGITHRGFFVTDPFAPRQRRVTSFAESFLSTALVRCWHLLVLYGVWSTIVTIGNFNGHKVFSLKPTLLAVMGTMLGFVIVFRTSQSFDRFHEGRRLWAQIVQSSRMFARAVWFHVPEPAAANGKISLDETKTRALIEKRTVLNLVEAYAVSVKHYLRHEDGIYYKDLYYLIKFLPAFAMSYNLPDTMPVFHEESRLSEYPPADSFRSMRNTSVETGFVYDVHASNFFQGGPASDQGQPPYVSSFSSTNSSKFTFADNAQLYPRRGPGALRNSMLGNEVDQTILSEKEEEHLLSARHAPHYRMWDVFPFSLIRKALIKQSKGRTESSRMRARLRSRAVNVAHNLPLEITLYISSYISAMQKRKAIDVPTTNQLQGALTQMVESLTSLERILTTPLPFSYTAHLWVVTTLYVFFLPMQIWVTMRWLTIPATIVITFIFFGFLVAGEEIENPFGYDKNDLDLDHFTHVIRCELKAITSTPPPDPDKWAFVAENDVLRSDASSNRVTPSEWIQRGHAHTMQSLSMY